MVSQCCLSPLLFLGCGSKGFVVGSNDCHPNDDNLPSPSQRELLATVDDNDALLSPRQCARKPTTLLLVENSSGNGRLIFRH
jgi:hypothetical protein